MRKQERTRSVQWQMTAGVLALSLGGALGVGSVAWAQAPLDTGAAADGAPRNCAAAERIDESAPPCDRREIFPGKGALAMTVDEAARARRRLLAVILMAKQSASPADDTVRVALPSESTAASADEEDEIEGNAKEPSGGATADGTAVQGQLRREEAAAGAESSPEDDGAANGAPGESDERPEPPSAEDGCEGDTPPCEQPSSETQASASPSAEGQGAGGPPCTITIGGTVIPYCDVRGGTTPSTGGGLWRGSDAVNDESWGYFVGHNPGSFAPVKQLHIGSAIALCDGTGTERTYTVCDIFSVDGAATWKSIADRVTGFGESIALQTCNDDGNTVTIVVAT